MTKSRLMILFAAFASLVFIRAEAWSARAYVSEAHEIALRSGPSAQSKVIALLQPNSPVEVLKPRNDWTLVRIVTAQFKSKEGWVQSHFLGTDSPESLQSRSLENQNAALKEQIALLGKEKNDLIQREKELMDKAAKLESSYGELKSGSSNYLKLKEELDSSKAALTSLQETNQTLLKENENLKMSQKIKWFILGAAVLFCGWLIGMISGRHKRKQRPSYKI